MMNKNADKNLVRIDGGGELAPNREYAVDGRRPQKAIDTGHSITVGRKRDWLDVVGDFLDDPAAPPKDTSLKGFLGACKNQSWEMALTIAPAALVMSTALVCAMDSYHWNIGKFSADGLRAMPMGVGAKTLQKELELIVPQYQSRPGEAADETQRRRGCIEAKLFRDADRYYVKTSPPPRGSMDVCEATAVTNSIRAKEALAK